MSYGRHRHSNGADRDLTNNLRCAFIAAKRDVNEA
jgi:hypothetical protein